MKKSTQIKISEDDVRKCIKQILADINSYSTSLNYAVNYCKAALNMEGHELKIQCLYILNNITHWRNINAKDIRNVLKTFANQVNL